MWTEPAALTCHVGAGEEETNAANLARLRRPDPIAGYCLHLFGVLEVIGSPSRTLGHPGLLLPSSVIFLRTYWIIDSERERVHVHMFLGRMRGRGGSYQMEQIKATIKAEKSQFVTIIATNGGQFRPRLQLLAAEIASGGDDERGAELCCHSFFIGSLHQARVRDRKSLQTGENGNLTHVFLPFTPVCVCETDHRRWAAFRLCQ